MNILKALYVKSEEQSLKEGGGLPHNLAGPTVKQSRKVPQDFVETVMGRQPNTAEWSFGLDDICLDGVFWIGCETLPVKTNKSSALDYDIIFAFIDSF